ncbi:NUDIX hydrolase [Neobacillus notoginsengisoli]|uniref:NUDIX hydrolase n=1 Tax=Neobacillus notoginsengisoli TaxID=1578198 RepID=A0A417YY02_9BACI|nr:NUDIX hydrolase [Neobacillus notoginsengisoli]RHW42629.1 NUDIX hydrolase [Neobacillus notoginsengisoli]
MASNKRGKVWLGAAGLVISEQGKWLVVKKSYGGLKGKWSLPAGFVDEGETADEAAVREVKEETGLDCVVKGLIGLRTGVINTEFSDNLLLFLLEAKEGGIIKRQENEIVDVAYLSPKELMEDKDASILIHYLIGLGNLQSIPGKSGLNPGNDFGYTTYRLFF